MTTNDLRQKVLDDMCSLGEMYLSDGNVDEALRWLKLVASLGNANADYKLGEMYYYGDGVPEDEATAAEYFLKSGFYGDDVIVGFGDMFRYGRGVDKDINKAIFFYESEANYAYDEESRAATFALGEIYRDGKKAVHYFMEFAFGGGDYFFVTDTKLYEDGNIIPMDYSERDCFFSFDTANGDDAARFALGCMYLYGQAVKKDVYKAAWWFAKMDELNCYDNGEVFDLAEMYRTGDGVERDVETALDYYERAAENGNIRATYRLSEIYRDGKGVKKNLSKSRQFLDATICGLLNKIEE